MRKKADWLIQVRKEKLQEWIATKGKDRALPPGSKSDHPGQGGKDQESYLTELKLISLSQLCLDSMNLTVPVLPRMHMEWVMAPVPV